MSKIRPNQPPERDISGASRGRPGRSPGHLPFVVRFVISLLVAWHLTAVFMAPMSISVATTESAIVAISQRPPMQWYLDALYLNHGYHFFAPDPGDGHLIRYQVMDDRGGVVKEGEFPNRKDQWPRLRYHRYFMLADQCQLPAPTEAEEKRWQETYLKTYARQLLREYGGQSVRVQRIVHYPLFRDDAIAGRPLTYPETYRMELEVVQRRQDLDLPAPNQSGAWNQIRRDVASGWQGGVR
jgi:hypothetical protein